MLGNEGEILIRKSYLESVFEIEHGSSFKKHFDE